MIVNSGKKTFKCLFYYSWFFSVLAKFLKSSSSSSVTKDLKMRSGRGDGLGARATHVEAVLQGGHESAD